MERDPLGTDLGPAPHSQAGTSGLGVCMCLPHVNLSVSRLWLLLSLFRGGSRHFSVTDHVGVVSERPLGSSASFEPVSREEGDGDWGVSASAG